jgi:hypothetical protein
VSVAATVRPDSWDFPLLVHVAGAMLLVGALVLAVSAFLFAWRAGSAALVRLGFLSMLLGVVPAWIVMRLGAEWIASKEDLTDSNASWIGMGVTTADGGIVVIVIATILAGFAVRRAARAEGGGAGLDRAAAVLASLILIAYLVAVWAMSTKPA